MLASIIMHKFILYALKLSEQECQFQHYKAPVHLLIHVKSEFRK